MLLTRRSLSRALVTVAFSLGACATPAAKSTSGSGGAHTSTASSGSGGGGGLASTTAGSGGAGGAAPSVFIPVFDNVRITSQSAGPNFQQANADIDVQGGPFAAVKLVVDLASTCYPFDTWKNDPPPAGQNWPPLCDAFDRNFEFSFDDPKGATDPPGIEVIRAITPFGGPLHLELDITDVANGLPGKHRMRVVIPTWSDGAGKVSGSNGGWNVTAKIEATPGKAPHKVLAVIPLFDGVQSTSMSPAPIAFTVPSGVTSSRLEYRATGHGGGMGDVECIGPAEEFCKRTHTIQVDGTALTPLHPWRNDCKKLCTLMHQGPAAAGFDYCVENPCGDVNSVKAPRANWCPGSLTPPFTWVVDALKSSGKHTFSWTINTVNDGGSWRLSAYYLAFGD